MGAIAALSRWRGLPPRTRTKRLRERCIMVDKTASRATVAVAALSILACVGFAVRFGASLEAAQFIALAMLLAKASVEDLRTRTIPNRCVIGALAVRVLYFAVLGAAGRLQVSDVGYFVASGLGTGAVLVAFSLAYERVTGREGMGGGDVKLYAVAGFYLGAWGAAYVIALSCAFALLAGLLAPRGSSEGSRLQRTMPFGPAIAAALASVALIIS